MTDPPLLARAAASPRGTVGPFVALGDSVLFPSLTAIRDGTGLVGYLLEWWLVNTSAEQAAGLRDLIGPDAGFLFGSGNVWTDQLHLLPPPAIAADTGQALAYARAGAGRRFGYTVAVAGTPWHATVDVSHASVLAPARAFLVRIILLAGFLLALGIAGIWWYTRRITAPLRELTAASLRIGAGEYAHRVGLVRDDELGQLAGAFDRMAAQIEAAHGQLAERVEELRSMRAQFVHLQRMDAVGRLAGGVAHDFNNMLSVILAEADLARAQLSGEHPAAEAIDGIAAAGSRAAGLTRQLLAFSRRQLVAPSTFSVEEMVEAMVPMLRRLLGERVTITCHSEATAPLVRADRGQVEQVLLNLAVNARDAMPQGGRLAIEVANVTLDDSYAATRPEVAPGPYVMLVVSDTGQGMPDEVQAHIFEPFYTTKPSGEGTGLGLATCYGIVRQHGGHIAAYSEAGVGSTFRVYLPLAEGPVSGPPGPAPAETGGSEHLLVVEDDAALRDVATRILARLGYRVVTVGSAEEALALLEREELELDLVVTDVVLPGKTGRELAEALVERRRGLRVLFVTGYTGDVILQHRLLAQDVASLQKPYTAESLGRKVREVLDAPAPA
ncbi:MAG: response regulator [Gemmatimonadetes bacterium]|nr:response regulator [Gemmatimonadota bacterium]